MDFLNYLTKANEALKHPEPTGQFSVALATNFTDDIFAKIFTGVAADRQVNLKLYKTPYKQYAFELKNQHSELRRQNHDLTFFFFDANVFIDSEFTEDENYFDELLIDLKNYAEASKGVVVVGEFLLPFINHLGNKAPENKLFKTLSSYNLKLQALANELSNVHIFNTNRLIFLLGQQHARDLRGLYAFDVPFSNHFFTLFAEQLFSFVAALVGKSKKCIVLDLDNTLWGGVVGEVGYAGIALGQGYPGAAFKNFQKTLLGYYEQGILLAINSKNNLADVEEVFAKNSNMVLKLEHFASKKINWDNKVDNFLAIAKELNIGYDSFIFFDDDGVNRELIKAQLPEVLVPDLSVPPENYTQVLLSLPVFSPFALTQEDKERGQKYAQEQQRQQLQVGTKDLSEFIGRLGISIEIRINEPQTFARVAQLSQKTNQFNLTTKRYSEKQIAQFAQSGWVVSGEVRDKFGSYGLTVVGIILPKFKTAAVIDTLLMSCRVMGRGVESRFMQAIIEKLHINGVEVLEASFIPTPKNVPAKEFLPEMGFVKKQELNGESQMYELNCKEYLAGTQPKVNNLINVNLEAKELLWKN